MTSKLFDYFLFLLTKAKGLTDLFVSVISLFVSVKPDMLQIDLTLLCISLHFHLGNSVSLYLPFKMSQL